MKIGLISDLHVDAASLNKQIIPHIVEAAEGANLDLFVLAGDLSANLLELAKVLAEFSESSLACPKLFVPGNHDIWVTESPHVTSQQKYAAIEKVCRECGFHPLTADPLVVHDVGFCGTIGWYDYSFRNESHKISVERYAAKQLLGSVWNDLKYAKWEVDDVEVAHRFEKELQNQINTIKDSVHRIVVITHHVPFQQCVRYRGKLPWDYFSAFMGSQGLGEICQKEKLVSHALYGHSHFPFNQQIGDVTAICSPVGYLYEPPKQGLAAYAQDRLAHFEI